MLAFVTGSTGLLGNNLVRLLVDEGWEVRALVRSPDKGRQQLGGLDGVTFVRGDLGDISAFASALDGVDVVFHTAAYFREYYTSGEHEALLDRLNVQASVALARAAHQAGVKRFVHTSSTGTVAPNPDGGPSDERHVLAPSDTDNLYFRSKILADLALADVVADTGLDLVTILPGWMFGPGDAGPTSAGQLVLDHLAGTLPPVALPGSGPITDARDVALGMLRAAERARAGDRFLLTAPAHPLREILEGLARTTDTAPPRATLPYPLAWTFALGVELVSRLSGKEPLITRKALAALRDEHPRDTTQAREVLGVDFRPMDETLRDTVAWFQDRQGAAQQEGPVDTIPSPA